MNVTVSIALIGASVSVIGWVISHYLSLRRDREARQLSAALAHTERQLERLYGPLTFLIHEGKRSFLDLLEILGRRYVFLEGVELPEEELRVWLFWVENDLLPRNEAIQRTLMSNSHLIEGGSLSDSTIRFLEHYNSWRMLHMRWTKDSVPYAWHSNINWPHDFEREVVDTFALLKARHQTFIGQLTGR